jgi:glutathione peroxidase
MADSLYDLSATLNDGCEKHLADYEGKVLLIVNTASQCGFTPQYKELEELYRRYRADGLEILAFPCDQFGHQEPGSDEEIRSFCETRFSVTFPLFRKIAVNGTDTHPVYRFLKNKARGLLGRSIRWNFTKFLVDRRGNVVKRFAPATPPRKIGGRVRELL